MGKGLQKVCKQYGGLTVRGNDGKVARYRWDYKANRPVRVRKNRKPCT